jgi:ABC-type amino acid transport substrate-binding protein
MNLIRLTAALSAAALAVLAAGCSNQASHRGGYLVARGFAPYDKDNPIARATTLLVSTNAVAGVAPNQSGEFYFFEGDLLNRELDALPVASQEEGDQRLARLRSGNPDAWREVPPGSPQARAAMQVLNIGSPRRPYTRATGSRLGDDRPVGSMTDLQPHRLPDGAGVSAAGN